MPGVAVPHLRRIAVNDTLLGVRRGEVAIINALGGSTKPKRCPSNMSCVAALKESLRLDKCSGFRNNRSRRGAFRQLFADPPTAPLPTQRCRDHSIFLTTWRPLADSSLRTPWYHPRCACVCGYYETGSVRADFSCHRPGQLGAVLSLAAGMRRIAGGPCCNHTRIPVAIASRYL